MRLGDESTNAHDPYRQVLPQLVSALRQRVVADGNIRPHGPIKRILRHQRTGVLGQKLENGESLGPEVDCLAADAQAGQAEIEFEAIKLQHAVDNRVRGLAPKTVRAENIRKI